MSAPAEQPESVETTPRSENTEVKPIPTQAEVPSTKSTKKSHKALWSALIVGFVIALVIVFLGIYFYQKSQKENELRAYENAMLSSEPAVLQNFLDMYVDASVAHRDSIKVHLKELQKIDRDWQDARISRSKSALLLFIQRNPENVHIPEAKLMVDSIDFVSAKYENTMEALRKYMEDHTDGAYYDEAKNEYDRMEEEIIKARQKAEQDSILAAQKAAEEAGEDEQH